MAETVENEKNECVHRLPPPVININISSKDFHNEFTFRFDFSAAIISKVEHKFGRYAQTNNFSAVALYIYRIHLWSVQ